MNKVFTTPAYQLAVTQQQIRLNLMREMFIYHRLLGYDNIQKHMTMKDMESRLRYNTFLIGTENKRKRKDTNSNNAQTRARDKERDFFKEVGNVL